MGIFVGSVVKSLQIRAIIIDEICTATASDRTLQMAFNHCKNGWPEISSLHPDVQQFAHSRVHLTVCDGLLMYGKRIVVPFLLRTKMLEALHAAH